MTERRCGECSLCCKLLPMVDGVQITDTVRMTVEDQRGFDKAAGVRCRHQRRTGCTIYNKRPTCCRLWSCRWLLNDDTAELRRPDRSHYVIDEMPDFVTKTDDNTGEETHYEAIQVWVDPAHPDAYKDRALLDYLARRGREDGAVAIIRYSAHEGFVLFPPALTGDGYFLAVHGGEKRETHTVLERRQGLYQARKQREEERQ